MHISLQGCSKFRCCHYACIKKREQVSFAGFPHWEWSAFTHQLPPYLFLSSPGFLRRGKGTTARVCRCSGVLLILLSCRNGPWVVECWGKASSCSSCAWQPFGHSPQQMAGQWGRCSVKWREQEAASSVLGAGRGGITSLPSLFLTKTANPCSSWVPGVARGCPCPCGFKAWMAREDTDTLRENAKAGGNTE